MHKNVSTETARLAVTLIHYQEPGARYRLHTLLLSLSTYFQLSPPSAVVITLHYITYRRR
ncbi:hypothetical protein BofuT4_uP053140.1 [Botrytis cinerea T4]|uniref:Uncharacterized protein n=1 Tax=Botryotinia fuckeliana (strain T4) TaxID=999810 RepID=G2XV93_BOTF4|nr:hypothetical protein BofuT4_uP053140.1 [Botrytis cinerea T4]